MWARPSSALLSSTLVDKSARRAREADGAPWRRGQRPCSPCLERRISSRHRSTFSFRRRSSFSSPAPVFPKGRQKGRRWAPTPVSSEGGRGRALRRLAGGAANRGGTARHASSATSPSHLFPLLLPRAAAGAEGDDGEETLTEDGLVRESRPGRRCSAGGGRGRAERGPSVEEREGDKLEAVANAFKLAPYAEPNLTWARHAFNEKVAELRRVAVDAFARLKGRWACLQKRTEVKLQDLPVVLGACCVLHNICESRGEEMDPGLRCELADDETAPENPVRSDSASKARDDIAHNLLHSGLAETKFF